MPALRKDIDPDGLLEYSVVYTDRALNHMSKKFGQVMTDLSTNLKDVYAADAVVIVPGSGTFAMEAIARQLATNKDCMIIRNGWFSYRWTQILDKGNIAKSASVLKAHQVQDLDAEDSNSNSLNNTPKPFAPVAIEDAVAAIKQQQPALVFAAHVETASGMILADDYIKALADAVHSVGGLLVIDCIASGCIWLDMQQLGIDILVSAPQKGWSSTPCAGLVMLNNTAVAQVDTTESSSFSLDLKQWLNIMRAYEAGGHAYHATMPTDSLRIFRDVLLEAKEIGFEILKEAQWELGNRIRDLLEDRGIQSVAAEGYQAPGVVVCYTDDDELHKGRAFAAQNMQIAAGVPLQVDEPANFKSFRIGLFGLDKLTDVDGAVERFKAVLDKVHPV